MSDEPDNQELTAGEPPARPARTRARRPAAGSSDAEAPARPRRTRARKAAEPAEDRPSAEQPGGEPAAAAPVAERPAPRTRATRTRARKSAEPGAEDGGERQERREPVSAAAPGAEPSAAGEESPVRARRTRTRRAPQAAAAEEPAQPAQEDAPQAQREPRRHPGDHRGALHDEERSDRGEGVERADSAEDRRERGRQVGYQGDEAQGGPRRGHRQQYDQRGEGGYGRQGYRQRGGSQGQGRQGFRSANGQAGNRRDQQGGKNRRQRHGQGREVVEPQTNREELASLKVAELRLRASELGVESAGVKKAELVEAVYAAMVRQEGFRDFKGILDIMQEGYGFVRTKDYLPGEGDVYVDSRVIRSMGLRRGDELVGIAHEGRPTDKYPAVTRLSSVNGMPPQEARNRPRFGDLTPVFPTERLRMEHGQDTILGRCIDIVAPIGKGQRGLIVSPPKAGKTTVLKSIAASVAANNPEVHLICLLVDERPEEVTDMQRSIRGEVVASTFDMPSDNHITVSELVIERAKRLVELGQDVVILLDSITRLARAYNLAQPASGRILSGGVDSTALYPPKRFLGAARNIENGGSLTILASALVETGSKMDEVIFEEFKGTGNMELRLDRDLADRRIFPAIDPIASGTRKEELLLEPGIAPFVWGLRRILAGMNNNERAMSQLIRGLKQTPDNKEFLIRCAKKAQQTDIAL